MLFLTIPTTSRKVHHLSILDMDSRGQALEKPFLTSKQPLQKWSPYISIKVSESLACLAAEPSWCLRVSFSFFTWLSSSLRWVFSAWVCSHIFTSSSLTTTSWGLTTFICGASSSPCLPSYIQSLGGILLGPVLLRLGGLLTNNT